jgi:hypothetical protein
VQIITPQRTTPARRQSVQTITREGWAPAALVLAVAVAAWLLTGVGAGDVALFAGHELGFVLVPGALVYAALAVERPGRLKLVAIGYAVGTVLEILAFALTAALHARAALWGYPPLAAAVAIALLRRGAGRLDEAPVATTTPLGGRLAWTLAGLCSVAIAYIAAAYFLFEPLPGRAPSAVYIPDLLFHLGVAGEALHHWPITDPKVAGIALPYHTFVHIKLAAASQITGIALPTLLFRLYVLPLIVVTVALLYHAGALVSRRRGVGIAAAALFVLVGQLGLDSHDQLVFFNTAFFSLFDSPSYILGLPLFLAALIVFYEQVQALRTGVREVRGWLLFALLLVGCAGAKASILPVLIGGLALYLLWQWGVVERKDRNDLNDRERPARDWSPAIALMLSVAVFVATYVLMYRGEKGGLKFDPPGSIRSMSVIQFSEGRLASAVGHPIFWLGASVVGLIGFCGATLAGVPAALASRKLRPARSTTLLMGLLVASLVPFFLLNHKGGSQNFFTYYGLCAACILSSQGLALMWDRAQPVPPRRARLFAALGAGWLGTLIAAAVLPYVGGGSPRPGLLYALWLGLPLAVVASLCVAAIRSRARRATLLVMAVGAAVLVGALDTPLHTGHFIASGLRSRDALYASDSPIARGLTPGLGRALAWIRDHTPDTAVIAVNNQFSDASRQSPDYYYYSAFGERRVFLEGWQDTIPAADLLDPRITPFPDRLRLNDAVFYAADARALRTMRRDFGVRYLLVDRLHGPVNPRLDSLAQVVLTNPGATVYRVP